MVTSLRRLALPLLPFAATLALAAQTSPPSGVAASASSTAPTVPVSTVAPGQAASSAAIANRAAKAVSAKDQKLARHSYERGSAALRNGHFDDAARAFAEAVQHDPQRPEYYQALTVAQETQVSTLLHAAAAQRTSHPLAAEHLLAEARGVDPTNPRITQRDSLKSGSAPLREDALARLHFVPAGAIVLMPNGAVQSFHERTDTRAFAATLGQTYGLRIAFDPDLQSKSFRMDLDSADYTTALQVYSTVAGVFATPLDAHTLLIAQDTTANRKRFEHLLQETVPLPGYSTEQINEAATMLRTVFDLQDQRSIQAAPQLGAILLRAPNETLHAMDTVLADLIDSGSEVTVDVKLYSVDTSKVRNLGVVLPTSFTLFSARSEIQNVINTNSALIQQLIANGVLPSTATQAEIAAYLIFVAGLGSSSALQNTFFLFGGGLSTLASSAGSYGVTPVGIATAAFPAVNFALQKSEASTLDDLQLRVADRATAVFKAGIRYPIQTSIYSDIASSATNNGTLASLVARYLGTGAVSTLSSSAIIPQFQFEDLGLTVNATPRVMSANEVALKLQIKISGLSGTALNGIPILASRQFDSSLQVQDGQTVMMASQLQDNEAVLITGIPGLNELPGLRNGTNRQTNASHTNLVLMITPHIVRHSHVAAKGPLIPLPPRPDDE